MDAVLNGFFGGSKPSASQAPVGDADFADFAGAPDPSPAGFVATNSIGGAAASITGSAIPYTKWYNIHERHSLGEFKQEGIIFGAIIVIVLIHLWGTRTNRTKAKAWIIAHENALEKEFALVGFGGRKPPSAEEVEKNGLLQAGASSKLELPVELLREKSPTEFATYATGRVNVAFMDVNINFLKRFNPLSLMAEYATSFFFDSMPAPTERMVAILYPFDGREALTVPGPGAVELKGRDTKSGYDGFVWAIVSKDTMKQLREERYDVSITSTKDSPKLPNWVTVMSESAEVTDLLLTPELVTAVEQAGDQFEHLIVTDQPIDKPTKLEETVPKKRAYLSLRIPSSGNHSATLPLFTYFIRLADQLASQAHFRPEVLRRVKGTRDDFIKKLQRADEEEKAEERNVEREKTKKAKRDRELMSLDAKAQKKYLEKEKEKEMRRSQKKQTQRA